MSGSAAGPSTAKEAALRLLIGDVETLLDRLESAKADLAEAHQLINADIQGFGNKVYQWESSIDNVMQHATYLIDQCKKVQPPPAPVTVQAKTPSLVKSLLPMLACSVLGATIALGGMIAFNYGTLEQARIGRAVNRALPYLDPDARKQLEAAVQKSGS